MSENALSRLKTAYIFWLARRLPACDEILPMISAQMDGKLSLRKWLVVILHNHICAVCKRYASQLLVIRQAMRRQAARPEEFSIPEATLSNDARERLKRSLSES